VTDGVSSRALLVMHLIEEDLTRSVIGAFYAVHRALGFGFLEHVHAAALERELLHRGHRVDRELNVLVQYAGADLAHQRLDMVVDDKVVLEIKSTEHLHRDAKRQLYNYLRATKFEVGLLLHFGRSAKFHRVIYTSRENPRGQTVNSDVQREPGRVS
jgi:GxxExxY protein